MATLKVAKIKEQSRVDGPGVRFSIYSQGCIHDCDGCPYPSTKNLSGGTRYDVHEIVDMISNVSLLLDGLTITGGNSSYNIKSLI